MFGDVRQPELIRLTGSELIPGAPGAIDTVQRSLWTAGPGFSSFLPRFLPHASPGVVPTTAPRSAIRHRPATMAGFVRAQPMPGLWFVLVRINQRVPPIRLDHLSIAGEVDQPSVGG